MIARALRRLAAAASLAVGVSLLLFLIFDSGVLGDAALVEAGERATPQALGAARLLLGQFRAFEPAVARLCVEGPPQRFLVRAQGGDLALFDLAGGERLRSPLAGRTVGEVLAEWDGRGLGGPWTLRAALAPASSRGSAPAAGLAAALRGTALTLDAGRDASLGWAQPVPAAERLLRQVGGLLRLDFGVSAASGQPIAAELWARARRSLALAAPAFVASTLLALLLALFCAARRGWLDRSLAVASAAGMSVTPLAVILFLQKWLAADRRWFPIYGWDPPWLPYLVLPWLAWICVAVWPDLRLYRVLALEELGKEYVRAARARGLGPWATLRRHVLPNVLVPVLALAVAALPFLALGSLLLERFFGIPGLGGYTVEAVLAGDQPVLRAVTFLLAVAYLAAQWLADCACAVVDPRLRRAR